MTLFPPSRANRPGVGDSPEKWYNGGGRFNADLRAVPFKQETETMRVAWIQRQFLDYRCAVFEEFDRLCGGNLTVFTLRGFTPDKVFARAERFLGDRLVGITKEWILGSEEKNITAMPNKYLRICYPPGLVGMILGTKPDVVFSDAFFQWSAAALWLNFTRKIPFVMGYERTAEIERQAQWYRRFSRRQALRWISCICANGSLTKEYLMAMGYPEERIFTGQMAADNFELSRRCGEITEEETAALRKRYSLEGKTVFLYVGQFIPRKGLIELVRAWKEFAPAAETAALVLVGGGMTEPEIKAYIERNRVPNVVLTGRVEYDRIVRYYAMADCYVMPTLSDNWSLVVPEAMACGLPVLCSKYNGCHPELIHGSNGMIFDPLDLSGTVAALRAMWEKRARFPEMGEASKRIVDDYSPLRAAETIYSACRYALDHPKR